MEIKYYHFGEFLEQMKEVTATLRKMNEANTYMRWQCGEPDGWAEFVHEMNIAQGWIESNC